MAKRCENQLLIRGPAEEIKRYKDSMLKDGNDYYPCLSSVPLPELKDRSEIEAYIRKEIGTTLWPFHYKVIDLEVIEKSSEELVMHFETAWCKARYFGEDLFPKLSILHKYFDAINNSHGFAHYVKGEVIAQGHENGEEQDSPWEMYEYNPKNYGIISQDQLRSIGRLFRLPEEGGDLD